MELNKIDGMSMNIEQTEMDKLKSVFPQCFAEGKLDTLITQIQKKLAKGKSLEQIADELEETVETILPLYKQIQAEMK